MTSETWDLGSPAGESGTADRGTVGTVAPITPGVFTFGDAPIRTLVIDDEPWFLGTDVARVLGYVNPSDAVSIVDAADRISRTLALAEGSRMVERARTFVNEAGVYQLVFASTLPAARDFRLWISREVIPSIARTGAYRVPETREQLLARAIVEANTVISEAHQQIDALTPRATAWDELAAAGTDYAVGDAAKILQRAGVETSPQRLFEQLRAARWIFRGGDRRWRAYAGAVQTGYLAERAMPPRRDPDTYDLIPVAPQVRVTARGLERLRIRLGTLAIAN